ncbi:MAG: hypothetical protein U9P72_02185 [Campylobacterota bacterium]|nr:hypothetical protein [Campylobacterota bacterium]
MIITALTETPIDFVVGYGGLDENGLHIQTQEITRELKNHILVKTRCGELLDLTTNERTSESKDDPLLEEIFLSRKKAKKKLAKKLNGRNILLALDEFGSFGHNLNMPR